MEFSDSKTKKFLIFSQKKSFSCISGNRSLHFSVQARKIKRDLPEKSSYT